jgi:hypothetical protein
LGAELSTYATPGTEWLPQLNGAHQANDWLEPIPLIAKTPDPIDPDTLPGVLGKFSRALARHTETPIDLSVLAVLGAASAALAGKIEIEAEAGYIEPAHVWVCPLLESGNRKTAVIDAVRAPIDRYQDSERERLEPELRRLCSERKTRLAAIEKLRKKLRVDSPDDLATEIQRITHLEAELPDEPGEITLTTTDITPEALEELMQANQGRMAIISDEGGAFDIMAGRYSSQPNLDVFLKGHTGSRVSTHRRSRSTFIPRAYLTICIVPQPGVIQDLKDKPFLRDRGLLARFLYAMPESPIGRREHQANRIPSDIHLDYHAIMTHFLKWQPAYPVRLPLSDPAYRQWKGFQRQIEVLMAEGGDLDRLHDWGGKLPGTALRIAGILSAASSQDLPPRDIQHETIARATALCTSLIPHAMAVFNLVDEDPKVSLAKRILRWLRKQKESVVTRRDCFRALRRHFDRTSEIDTPLHVLVEHLYIRTETAQTGGRPSERIEINPKWRRHEVLA